MTITDELLGKGGFGEVYLADYNGRNAAAKVLITLYCPSFFGASVVGGRVRGEMGSLLSPGGGWVELVGVHMAFASGE